MNAIRPKGYLYLGTPYTLFFGGLEEAFRLACRVSAELIAAGVPTFSPIAHSHSIAVHGNLDQRDHDLWLSADAPMMHAACGLAVYKAQGWEDSRGVREEIKFFKAERRTIFMLDPGPIAPHYITIMRGLCTSGNVVPLQQHQEGRGI